MSSLNKTPSANRLHITLFGKRNVGKSSLFNALTSQSISIVSEIPGTTTDPVSKAMEIAPLGPVVITDTAGIDDLEDPLGKMRVEKSLKALSKTDLAIFVVAEDLDHEDKAFLELLQQQKCPYIVAFNKIDTVIYSREMLNELWQKNISTVSISATTQEHLDVLIQKIIEKSPQSFESPTLLGDLIQPGDIVQLVIPIDKGMPRGRLILPQIQTMRDILDHQGLIYASKETEIEKALQILKTPPRLVITDSQIFELVAQKVPESIFLTSFSILMARFKGDLAIFAQGAKMIPKLKKNDKILIAEACTHVQQDQDIATVKIPQWIHQHIDPSIQFEFINGTEFPAHLKEFALVIHCGGCMINRKEMLNRIQKVVDQKIPITNYGLAIASMHNILDRALKIFES